MARTQGGHDRRREPTLAAAGRRRGCGNIHGFLLSSNNVRVWLWVRTEAASGEVLLRSKACGGAANKETTWLITAMAIARQQQLGHDGIGDYMHAKKR